MERPKSKRHQDTKAADQATSEARREAVETLCGKFQELPDLDSRSTEEILGYNGWGLF